MANLLLIIHFILGYIFLAISVNGVPLTPNYRLNVINRTSFPTGFVFGAGTSAYQVEGAAYEDGKGSSIWDTWTRKNSDKIRDHSNGNKATDSYHRYKDDVKLIKQMNMDAYRFSISWSRILPSGMRSGGVNEHGIAYYDNLINELKNNGIEPYVTLFHWDLPQFIEDDYGGFLSSKIVDDFRDYADVCFSRFGDRVKYWITLNEPYTYSTGGYEFGFLAPGRCSAWLHRNCTDGDSGIEPYLVTHNLLLTHAAAAHLYKDKYQAIQKGNIGITLVTRWMVPYTEHKIDRDAAIRALDFELGWYLNPLTFGDYPQTMHDHVTDRRLPQFTLEESYMLRNSYDFLGLNYYTSDFVQNVPLTIIGNTSRTSDARINVTSTRNGVPIGGRSASYWLYDYPKGMHDLLVYIRDNYNNPPIYITENGIDEINNSSLPLQNALQDDARIAYYSGHLTNLCDAINDGANVKGFFAWSLMDVFEWDSGYTIRFGLNFVDFKDNLKRYQKNSAVWFANFLHKRN